MSGSLKSVVPATLGPSSAAEAEKLAERLRGDLAETLDRLGDNLVPTRLASEAAGAIADRSPPWLKDYWRPRAGTGRIGASLAPHAASIALGVLVRRRGR